MDKRIKEAFDDLGFGEKLTLGFKLDHKKVTVELVSLEVEKNKEEVGE